MPHQISRTGLIFASRPSLLRQVKPELLRDVLRMKRNRGDADADQFKQIAINEFAFRLNATVSGAAWAMRQWVAKAEKLGWDDDKVQRCMAFLGDLDTVLAGDMRGWDIATAEAA